MLVLNKLRKGHRENQHNAVAKGQTPEWHSPDSKSQLYHHPLMSLCKIINSRWCICKTGLTPPNYRAAVNIKMKLFAIIAFALLSVSYRYCFPLIPHYIYLFTSLPLFFPNYNTIGENEIRFLIITSSIILGM